MPFVTSVSPVDGRRQGGTPVTITGKNFSLGTMIYFDKLPCTGTNVTSPTSISCLTPPHVPQTVNVIAINPDRYCGALMEGYTYLHAIQISPQTITLAVGNTATFSAAKGKRPYTFTVLTGGGLIDSTSGAFTAPDTPGTTVIRVSDSNGTQSEALVLTTPALAIYPKSNKIKAGERAFYSASGGVPPYTYQVTSGTGTISSDGVYLAPMATNEGIITVEDTLQNKAQAAITVIPPVIEVRTNTIVNQKLPAPGGEGPYTTEILAGPGSVDPETHLYVTPDIPGTAILKITDSKEQVFEQYVNIYPALFTYPSEKTVLIGDTVPLLSIGGIPGYKYSLTTGQGKLLDQSGFYVAPTAAAQETIKTTDAFGNQAEFKLSVAKESVLLHQLALGHSHQCVIIKGAAKCWGSNKFGQLGNKSKKNRSMPVPVEGLSEGVITITSGLNHSCALVYNTVKCWGDNTYGQLGNVSRKSSSIPVQVSGLTYGIQAIVAGDNHTCAIMNGSLVCWGDNRRGQLGIGSTLSSAVPIQVKGLIKDVTQVSAGTHHTCAIQAGAVKCWGYNLTGQLGNGTVASNTLPVQVIGITEGATLLASGSFHNCALVKNILHCWGYNGAGELGINSTVNQLVPAEVKALGEIAADSLPHLTLGSQHSCLLTKNPHSLRCWGYNFNSEATESSGPEIHAPQTLKNAPPQIDDLAASVQSTCSLFQNKVECWGKDYGPPGRYILEIKN